MRGQYDVIVVGAGPAGLSAALYAARAKYRVLVLEKEKMGGQITITSEIVNYPGVEKTDGTELTEQMRRQAEAFGAEFAMAEVTGIDLDGDIRTVKTDKGEYRAPGIVLAVGANPRKLALWENRNTRDAVSPTVPPVTGNFSREWMSSSSAADLRRRKRLYF